MRLTNFVTTVFMAGPWAVDATGALGWALGNSNSQGACKALSDWQADLAALKGQGGNLVRVYASADCDTAKNLISAARDASFQVLLGIWISSPDADMSNDTAALQASIPGNEATVFGITVGSECLYRKELTGDQLLSKIQEVQNLFPQVTVGTADSWNKIADGTADPVIKGGVTLLLANAFSYWQGQDVKNATATYFDDMMQAIGHVQEVSGSLDAVHVMSGETGWPSDGGTNYQAAIAGTANAMTYWKSGICGMLDWGVDLFWFEAFDEPNKPNAVGQDGAPADEKHWGAFDSNRTAKFDLTC